MLIDMARCEDGAHPMDDDTWWLHLYVMISRATQLEDLLLLRAPPVEFLLRGPPEQLRERLRLFGRRTKACHARAEELARDLGLARFLR